MRPPPLLLAACAALWGVETGQWVVAALLALVLESHRLIHARWDISSDDIRKLATVCNVILLLVVAYFLTLTAARATLPKVLQWLPVILLPLMVASQFSTTGKINPTALFLLLKRRADQDGQQPTRIHLGFPFAVLLVLAAGGSNERDLVYYSGVAVIAGWSLWAIRPRRYSPLIWAGVFFSVAWVGLLAHIALNNFQHWLVDAAVDLLSGSRTDPYKHTTDLGHIGTLKLSDEILMRVDPGENLDIPLLLHRASYNLYREKTWLARRAPLQAVGPAPVSGKWALAEGQAADGQVSVVTQLNDGLGVLALPTGTVEMNNLSIIEMKRNRLGTFRVVGDAGLMRYSALVDSEVSLPAAPDEDDLVIAQAEFEVIHKIADQLGLKGQSPTAAIASLDAYFKSQYRYSLYQQGSSLRTPLSHFLTTSHAGHCEYFATATTLLLRAAGIPTRYATGFSVQEYSQLEGVYLVRLRHAHSWARAYVDGKWQDIDNTPPSWLAVEEKTASILEPLVDLFSWLWHRFTIWRLDSQRGDQQWVLLLALPVIGYLLWRMRGQRKRTALEKPQLSTANEQTWQGMDSDLFRIEALLNARGFGRHAGETSFAWARRLADTERQFDSLLRLVELHYQKRFGDRELSPDDRSRFADLIADWLAEPGTSVLSEP